MRSYFGAEEIGYLLEELGTFSMTTGKSGVTRLAFGEADETAHHFLAEKIASLGLNVSRDAMGNIFARLPGWDRSLPAVGTGSHIDSVPSGGLYDGTLGVVGGLYSLLQFRPEELRRDLELVVFRGEESSRFGFSCIGSKILTGHCDEKKWRENTDDSGLNVFQAMTQCGYSVNQLARCELADKRYSAFVELHIEQGRVLENEGKAIGIVHGIAAPTRYRVTVTGCADHSGATPMYQRHDALVASAMMINDIHHAACKEIIYGTVGTVGKLDVSPNAMNVIPGLVKFYVDIRGIDPASIQRVAERLQDSVAKTARENDVEISLELVAAESPVPLDDGICEVIENVALEQGVSYRRMMSGAGHDAMYMAGKYPTAMIFAPSKNGISHHPDEYTSPQQIITAADVLKQTLARLANAE
ncbi:Zn-dependent hydrolase [Brenneria populi subsp. brevivirga]|uniref:Zn-dependent hydrolase n=1 Tax=Brenneria populi TaxID=1505588 RepID=UPI002E1701F3|nr:Zn-dependent hydrolase [Brenneria populi subsp. brevivirga]